MTYISDIAGLGSTVRAARTHAGLTQAALAAACGLSRQTIAQLEAGTFSDLGIRKVGRVLARLGLDLRVEPAGTAYIGEGTGTRLGRLANTRLDRLAGSRLVRLLRARGEARKQIASRLAAATLRKLRKEGISARLIGSLVTGRFRPDSDVDFLIEDRGGLSESRITGTIERSMGGFPFDVVFADRADPELLKFMRDEVRGGAPAVRPA